MKRHVMYAILVLVFCTMVLLLIIGFARGRSRAMPGASLVFLGFTNLPAKGDGVLFCCSNDSAKRIYLGLEGFDTFSSGKWEKHRLDNGNGRGGLNDEAKGWLDRFNGTPSPLGPSEAATFYVPSPAANTAWRVRLSCVEQTLGDKIRKHTIGGRVAQARRLLWWRVFQRAMVYLGEHGHFKVKHNNQTQRTPR